MVFFAGAQVETVNRDNVSLLEWHSDRIKRQCRSTLAAETMSMDAGVDAASYCRELFPEILIKDDVPSQCGRLLADLFPVIAVTNRLP